MDINPYSRSLFTTQKYASVCLSKTFDGHDDVLQWDAIFVQLYNHSHRHYGIKYVTPVKGHYDEDTSLLVQRKQVYEETEKQSSQRWSGAGATRNWSHEVMEKLNPVNEQLQMNHIKQAA